MLLKIKLKRLIIINIILLLFIRYLPNNNVEQISINNEITTEISVEEVKQNIEITSRSDESRQEEQVEEKIEEDKTLQGYRVTSYHPGDNCLTGTKTGSGKTINDFNILNINGKQVYTYQGKIVVAGATKELLKSGYNNKGSQNTQNKHYFNYYDTGRIKINGNWYGFIVLDSCGAAMWEGYYRLDIFVPSSKDVIDTKNVEIVYD